MVIVVEIPGFLVIDVTGIEGVMAVDEIEPGGDRVDDIAGLVAREQDVVIRANPVVPVRNNSALSPTVKNGAAFNDTPVAAIAIRTRMAGFMEVIGVFV